MESNTKKNLVENRIRTILIQAVKCEFILNK